MDEDGIPIGLKRIALGVWQRQIGQQRPEAAKLIGDPSKYLELDGLEGFDLTKQQAEIIQAKLLIQSKPRKRLSLTISIIKALIYVFVGFILATTITQCQNNESARTWFVWLLDLTGYMIMSFGSIYRSNVTNMYEQTVVYTNALVATIRGVSAEKRPKVQFNLWQVRIVFAIQILWSLSTTLVILMSGDHVARTFGEDSICNAKSETTLAAHDWILFVSGLTLVGLVATQWILFVGRKSRLWWFYAWSMEVLEAGFSVTNNIKPMTTKNDIAGVRNSFAVSAQNLLLPAAHSKTQ